MKDVRHSIVINKPVQQVFDFTLNPENTPKWVDSIVVEQANEWPVKLGSIYRNQHKDGRWSEYEVVAFERDKMFVLKKMDDDFYVEYRLNPGGDHVAELEYRIWKDQGHLPKSLDAKMLETILKRLKEVIETGV